MAKDFYAKYSWDYLVVRPQVISYLETCGFPPVVSDTQIYDEIQAQDVARFASNRLFHCISRVLKEVGYARRSRRGRAWDLVGRPETYKPVENCQVD